MSWKVTYKPKSKSAKKVTGFASKECHDCLQPFTLVYKSDDTVNIHNLLYPLCTRCSRDRWNSINWDA